MENVSPGVMRVAVANDSRDEEYVLVEPSPPLITAIAEHARNTPRIWLTVIPARGLQAPDGMVVHYDDEAIMATPLVASPPSGRAGQLVERLDRVGVAYRVSYETNGVEAASGQVAITDGCAIFDRISTADTHRRQGFGSDVMKALTELAMDAGAHTGVLAASRDGQALYGHLGWSLVAPMTTFATTAN